MIRKKKQYVKPRQIFETERIKEENALVKKYGLKNKREVWKTQAKVDYFRHRAKEMASLPIEEQEILFGKMRYLGLAVNTTADVLDLKVEDLLERRLPTIVAKKKLASTPKHARQMVVHKRILIDGKAVSAPSYIVPVSEESLISLKEKVKNPKVEKADEKAEAPVEGGEEKPVEEKKEDAPKEEVKEEAKE